jgi:hypothetical protein
MWLRSAIPSGHPEGWTVRDVKHWAKSLGGRMAELRHKFVAANVDGNVRVAP